MHLCFLITSLEIIQLVEKSHLSARQTLVKLGIPRTTFYRWYNRYLQRGEAGLQDRSPKPKHVWNRVPDEVKRKVVDFALKETELSQPFKLSQSNFPAPAVGSSVAIRADHGHCRRRVSSTKTCIEISCKWRLTWDARQYILTAVCQTIRVPTTNRKVHRNWYASTME